MGTLSYVTGIGEGKENKRNKKGKKEKENGLYWSELASESHK